MRPASESVDANRSRTRPAGVGIEKFHHVARTHHDIEAGLDTEGGEVQFRQVGHQPGRAGMVEFGGGDQDGIEVDADHLVAELGEMSADAAGAAASVEYPCVPTDQCVDQPSLTVQVGAFGGHPAKPLDVPLGMSRTLLQLLDPPVARHAASVAHTPNHTPSALQTR